MFCVLASHSRTYEIIEQNVSVMRYALCLTHTEAALLRLLLPAHPVASFSPSSQILRLVVDASSALQLFHSCVEVHS